MPKSENQKLKLLYLAKIFQEKTDEDHGITMTEIMAELAQEDIRATRKTLYADIKLLRRFGRRFLAGLIHEAIFGFMWMWRSAICLR